MYRPLGKLSAHRHPYYRQLGKLSGRVINRAAVKHGLSNKWLGTCSHIPQGRCARRTSLGDLVMVTYTHLTVTDLPGTEGHICHWRDAFLFVVRSKTHVYTVGKSRSHRQKKLPSAVSTTCTNAVFSAISKSSAHRGPQALPIINMSG